MARADNNHLAAHGTGAVKDFAKLSNEYDPEELKRLHKPLGYGKGKDVRTGFEKDRDRIIHCAAFRRLQGKTQVFGMGGSDFFRTRLTHSLEVAQIAKGIALYCGHANTELVEAASLAHDIGHPPFGHTGENVLKQRMRKNGGFEANAQNLRILDKLEVRTAEPKRPGLNLTRATLDALLKYKRPYSKVNRKSRIEDWKFYYNDDHSLVKFACSERPKIGLRSFECQIMDWADDVAYSTHDLEDGIKVGMITESKVSNKIETNVKERVERKGLEWNRGAWDSILEILHKVSGSYESELVRKGDRKDTISALIYGFITSTKPEKRTEKPPWSRYEYELKIDSQKELECNILKSLVWELIINDERVSTLQRKAVNIVNRLFDELTKFSDRERTEEMYPADFRERLQASNNRRAKMRVACDYIAGMTDTYAARMYSRLTEGEASSLFEVI